jgi:hypothetical protein
MSFKLVNTISREVPVYMPSGDKNAYKQHVIKVEYYLLNEDEWGDFLSELESLDRAEQYEREKELLEKVFIRPLSEIVDENNNVLDEEEAKYALLQHTLVNKAITKSYFEIMNKNNFRRSGKSQTNS